MTAVAELTRLDSLGVWRIQKQARTGKSLFLMLYNHIILMLDADQHKCAY